MDDSDSRVVVGRIGRPHGIKGHVHVQVLTDLPDVRFAPGAAFAGPAGALVVSSVRWHHGRLIASFEGVDSREAAEAVRGCVLEIDRDQVGDPGEDAWWVQDLVGLRAELTDGQLLGQVREVVHLSGQDLLAVGRVGGGEVLVPFVAVLVPLVDVAGGRLVIDPPEGLLEL